MISSQKMLTVGDGEISVTFDEPDRHAASHRPVVLVPPFGMSAERLLPVSYLLTTNGFNVIRFDPRNHPGESTGTMFSFCMSRLVEDIGRIVDDAGGGIIVGMSLGARSVLRVLATTSNVDGAVLLTPVVNTQHTVQQVTGRDWFKQIVDVDDSVTAHVLGYEIGPTMIHDCIDIGFVDVEDSIVDVIASTASITFIAGDADPWVAVDDVRSVARAGALEGRDVDVVTVPTASHHLYRNPVLAMTFFRLATERCMKMAGLDPAHICVPLFSDVVRTVEESKLSGRP